MKISMSQTIISSPNFRVKPKQNEYFTNIFIFQLSKLQNISFFNKYLYILSNLLVILIYILIFN